MTLAEEPKAYFYVPATNHTMWNGSEFTTAKEWPEQQRPAEEAEAKAEMPE